MSEGPSIEQPPGEPSYETNVARVEEIIRRLDAGETSLTDTLELVREGKELIERCAGELEAVGERPGGAAPGGPGGAAGGRGRAARERGERHRRGPPVSTWELLAELAGADRGLRAGAPQREGVERVRALLDGDPATRRGRGGARRGRHLRRAWTTRSCRRLPAAGRRCRWRAASRWPPSQSACASSSSSRSPPSGRSRGATGCGRTSRRRSTSRCARRGPRCTSCSAASPRRCASWCRCVWASLPPSSRCTGAWSSTRGCASSSTRRARGMSR